MLKGTKTTKRGEPLFIIEVEADPPFITGKAYVSMVGRGGHYAIRRNKDAARKMTAGVCEVSMALMGPAARAARQTLRAVPC